MKKILVPLAPGFEEIEAVTVVDILRRAGADVAVAGLVDGQVEGRSGIKVMPDTTMDSVSGLDFDMIVLPGGAVGAENLENDEKVKKMVRELYGRGKTVAAICAGPKVLSAAGVTDGRAVTAHPSVAAEIKGLLTGGRVVVDKNLITGKGPGTAMEFAFKLVEALFGPEKAKEVNETVFARL